MQIGCISQNKGRKFLPSFCILPWFCDVYQFFLIAKLHRIFSTFLLLLLHPSSLQTTCLRCSTSTLLKCFFAQSSAFNQVASSQPSFYWTWPSFSFFSTWNLSEHKVLKNLPGNLSISFTEFSSTSRLLIVVMLQDSILGPFVFSVFTHTQVISSILSTLYNIPMLMNP